jgi:ubiquinone/menaquinone biosynthesis C-methylase UbiE
MTSTSPPHGHWTEQQRPLVVTIRRRFLILVCLLALVAFYAGTRLITTQRPPVHPLTGRQIAGLATDARWLDRAAREEEEEPERALDLIGITPGSAVAEIGAGTGYMTIRIARRVGTSGKVYANDLQPALLEILQRKARQEHLSNVEIVLGTQVDARLPDNSIELALLVDVYHEMWFPQQMLRSIRRSLKPRGRLVLVEYRKEDPHIPIAFTHRLSVAEARTEVEAEGFVFDRVVSGLPRQHIIIFRR